MAGFVEAEGAVGEAGGRQHAEGAGDHAGFIGEDVAKHVRGEDNVELVGAVHQLHGGVVHIHVGNGHFGVVGGHFGDYLAPQAGGFEHVGLVHAHEVLAAGHGGVEGHLGDAADLHFGIAFHVVGFGAVLAFAPAVFAEVDAAGVVEIKHKLFKALDENDDLLIQVYKFYQVIKKIEESLLDSSIFLF